MKDLWLNFELFSSAICTAVWKIQEQLHLSNAATTPHLNLSDLKCVNEHKITVIYDETLCIAVSNNNIGGSVFKKYAWWEVTIICKWGEVPKKYLFMGDGF